MAMVQLAALEQVARLHGVDYGFSTYEPLVPLPEIKPFDEKPYDADSFPNLSVSPCVGLSAWQAILGGG